VEVDGGCAVLVTSLDRARDLRLPPVVVKGGGWVSSQGGLDTGDLLYHEDTSRNFASRLAPKLWATAGLGPGDVDIAELYDCFTGALIENFEGLGLCERGGAGAFHREGHTRIDGKLPTNTNGGLLSEGYLHGMNTVAEAVWQLQGQGGPNQVRGAEVGVVTSGGLSSGSGLVLTVDR
jgi:acetyl-CoA acetyltransferase